MSFKLGLTGSIGMGKSTTAQMFRDRGLPVWDADATVHRLYSAGGKATKEVAKIAPEAIGENGVDRGKLRDAIAADPGLLKKIEHIVHPLVVMDRFEFIQNSSDPILVFDIPLIYETNTASEFDAVAVVSADAELQRARVLERPNMDEDALNMILSKQVGDAEKRARADYIIDTTTIDTAKADVSRILSDIEERISDA